MTPAAVTPSAPTTEPKASPELTKALNFLRSLPPEDLKALRAKLRPEQAFSVPRTPAGGIAESLEIDDILEIMMQRDEDRSIYPGRYYFSKIFSCFRKEGWKEQRRACDHGIDDLEKCETCRFDAGKSEPGHASEDHLQHLMEQVYTKGKPGSVLKDMRISVALEAECEDKDGKGVVETIYIIGKTDTLVMGDNFEVLEFNELKTPIFWPAKKNAFIKTHGKVVPLFLAGIEEPTCNDGIVNVNNAIQLAVGVHILRKNGLKVRKVSLTYMSRERYRDYVKILFTEAEVEFLYNLAVWWTTEFHAMVKRGVFPPLFFMGYECRNCPFQEQCVKECAENGETRKIHPSMVGINDRLAEANGSPPRPKPAPKVVKRGKRKDPDEADARLERAVKAIEQDEADKVED